MSRIESFLRTVEIADTCPVCGGPRGTAVSRPFCEDGEHYSVDCWANECGHVDQYKNVLVEADSIKEQALEFAR